MCPRVCPAAEAKKGVSPYIGLLCAIMTLKTYHLAGVRACHESLASRSVLISDF